MTFEENIHVKIHVQLYHRISVAIRKHSGNKPIETQCVSLPVEMVTGVTVVGLVLMLPVSESLDE